MNYLEGQYIGKDGLEKQHLTQFVSLVYCSCLSIQRLSGSSWKEGIVDAHLLVVKFFQHVVLDYRLPSNVHSNFR